MKDQLFISFYRFVVAPLMLTLLVFFIAPFHKKVRKTLGQKLKPPPLPPSGSVWIHAASGEFEYAKSLLKEYASDPLFVSYTSPGYVSHIQRTPGLAGSGPLPLDLPGPVDSFLQGLKPKALFISRTDVWPELIYQCHQKQIPIYPFAITQQKPKFIFRAFKAWMLNKCTHIFCVSETDKQNLIALGVTRPISAIGDPRWDTVFQRVNHPKIQVNALSSKASTLMLGSTWAEDERVILPAIQQLLKTDSVRVFWAPHEPSEGHFQKSLHRFRAQGIPLKKFSDGLELKPKEIMYIDEIGILADLYKISDISFIGGSFRSQVHSVMEPLAHGNWVLVGPKNQNNREAQQFKTQYANGLKIVEEVATTAEILKAFKDRLLLNSRNDIQMLSQNLQGATEEIKKRLTL